jgi:4-amino-4-deoxy-L-arabinose transferase-like glycosyltransferase
LSQSLKSPASLLIFGLLALIVYRSVSGFFSPLPLQVDEAQYLGWARDLAFGYYSKPPMIAWMLAANRAACDAVGLGGPIWIEGCARMSQAFALGIAGLFAALASWALFGDKAAAVAAALLLLTSPLLGFLSLFATTDAWLLMFWSVGLWAFIKAVNLQSDSFLGGRRPERWGYWMACGVALGLGLLAKYSMGVFVISALLVLLRERRLFSWGPWVAALTALLIFSPNLFWNAAYGFPTLAHHLEIAQVQQGPVATWSFFGALQSLAEFGTAQFLLLGPFALISFLFWMPTAFACRQPSQATRQIHLLLMFALPMLAIMILQALTSRAFANWAAPAYLAIAVLVGWLWTADAASARSHRIGSILLKLSILFGLLFSVLCIHGLSYSYHASDAPKIRAVEKLRGWKEAAEWIALKAKERDAVVVADDRWLLANLTGVSGLTAYALDWHNRRNNHYSWFYNIRDQKLPPDQWLLIVLVGDESPAADILRLTAIGFRDVDFDPDFFQSSFGVGKTGDRVRVLWARR